MIPPTHTNLELSSDPDVTNDSNRMEVEKADLSSNRNSECSSSNNDVQDKEYVTCFIDSLGPRFDCKRMFDGQTTMFTNHDRKMRRMSY